MASNITQETRYTIPEIASPALERGPLWIRDIRRASLEAFNSTPVPRRGLALWRYTDPETFLIRSDVMDTAFGDHFDEAESIETKHFEDGTLDGLVIDHGGRRIDVRLSGHSARNGIVIMALSDAIETHRELVERHLYQAVNSRTGKFEAMNGALWNDGVFVFIPDNKTVERPIHLIREAGRAGSASFPRLLVVVGANAEVTLVDEYAGGERTSEHGLAYTNGAVEIFGGPDSRTRYISLQRQAEGTISYLTHRARIGTGASMLTVPFAFGASISKQNFGVDLNGEGATSKMVGLVFGNGRQHFDNHTLHHHTVGQTFSDIDFKVVLRGKSRSAYTGLIRIDHHAKSCEAYQENRNLLLNRGTKAETIPELEILNEDVSCSHGATVGPIDDMQVFYLMARGIHYQEAVRMVVSGFVRSSITAAPADLQERLSSVISERLGDL
ncbi:MAG: Fe-S cluster assembly protein SufD [candidate division Zixibacteria bacterium]|jgi:Fe-S cluster assembly protein SufD|nr:Fe-S cluster assembly protein SufD [candidate division Zixibacteria bacterium]